MLIQDDLLDFILFTCYLFKLITILSERPCFAECCPDLVIHVSEYEMKTSYVSSTVFIKWSLNREDREEDKMRDNLLKEVVSIAY